MNGPTAELDPWCTVTLSSGETLLFGFAMSHPATRGLAWTRSSELLELDVAAGTARTRSGHAYRLGRRFDLLDVNGEGEEAGVAFELLIGGDFDGADALRELDLKWVAARKIARHLVVPLPPRLARDVQLFLGRHLEAYLDLRSRHDRQGGG